MDPSLLPPLVLIPLFIIRAPITNLHLLSLLNAMHGALHLYELPVLMLRTNHSEEIIIDGSCAEEETKAYRGQVTYPTSHN